MGKRCAVLAEYDPAGGELASGLWNQGKVTRELPLQASLAQSIMLSRLPELVRQTGITPGGVTNHDAL